MNMAAYSMRVFWSDADAGFIALCPELDVSAFGDTYEEAVRELQVAIRLTLEVYAADNETPPQPATAPSHSGQLRVRLPRSLHARLAAEADEEGVSLNTLIVSRLSGAPNIDLSSVARTINSIDGATRTLTKYLGVRSLTSGSITFDQILGDTSPLSEIWEDYPPQVSSCADSWWENSLGEPFQVTRVAEEKKTDVQKLVA